MPLKNYSDSLEAIPSSVHKISSVAALRALVESQPAHAPLLLRATGNSIHDQALTKHAVALLGGLPHEVVLTPDDVVKTGAAGPVRWTTIRATAWTPWEVVMRCALRIDTPPQLWRGKWDLGSGAPVDTGGPDKCVWASTASGRHFVPYVVPSSGRITVGGSLSADTMWRFSTLFGHEARAVVWIDVLAYRTQNGARKTYTLRLLNEAQGLYAHRALHAENGVEFAPTQAENDRWFCAVNAGFGLLGPILGAKYMVLELRGRDQAEFHAALPTFDGIHLRKPDAPAGDTADPREHAPERAKRAVSGELEAAPPPPPAPAAPGDPTPPWSPPTYPHAADAELGHVGESLTDQALTWMWDIVDTNVVFDALVAHHFQHAQSTGDDGMHLPRDVKPDTATCFGLFFPNHKNELRTVVGSVAFGKPQAGAGHFKMWDRRYTRSNTPLVVAALPWLAAAGEAFAFLSIFHGPLADTQNGLAPHANPIPEFAMFMEGHSVALDAMHDHMPKTVQQAWVLPIPNDPNDAAGMQAARALFHDFLGVVRKLSTDAWDPLGMHRPIRIQICDVKVLPRGHAILSSASKSPVIAITMAIEDGKDYGKNGWGDPAERYAELTHQFLTRGVRVHLTKNRYVDPADVKAMYGAQMAELRKIKQQLDPDGLYGSAFSDAMP
ncbi:MAG: hypothetical protein U0234_04965 [Sandaracinus sp.]